MNKGEHQSLEQIQAFMEGNEGVDFKGRSRKEVYEWTQATLCWHSYGSLGREDKGLVKQYVSKVTGLSRAQATRLVGRYVAEGIVEVRQGKAIHGNVPSG